MTGKLIPNRIHEETWAWIILLLSGTCLFIISLISGGLYGDTDSITHYLIARYSFRHPDLLVDHWGKPLFTILSAPFAQLGLQGSILFNILCGLVTAWMIFRIAKQLGYRYALLAIPFTLFAPVYMVTLFTSLTEILFATLLVAAILLFLMKKPVLSAVVISFIPYARTEGLMFIALFLLAFFIMKQFRAMPFLLTGFILFSIGGYFHYREFLWFFTSMPYSNEAGAVYGSGSFWYYLERFHKLLGLPLTILAGMGFIYLFIKLFRARRPLFTADRMTVYFLLTGSFVGYIVVQSFLWWKGWMAVLASPRFMASIMPVGSLLALVGLNVLLRYPEKTKWVRNLLLAIITGYVIYTPFTLYEIPARLTKGHEVMKETAKAFRHLDYKNRQIVYFDPKFVFYLEEDPFNVKLLHFRIPDKDREDLGLQDGSYLIWDSHFADWECNLPLEYLLDHPNFKLIDSFVPTEEFKFFTGRQYMSVIFQKVKSRDQQDYFKTIKAQDFENTEPSISKPGLSSGRAFSGKYSNRLDARTIYSFSLSEKLADLSDSPKIIIRGKMKAFIPEGADPTKLNLVVEIRDSSRNMARYLPMPASFFKPGRDEWTGISIVAPVRTDLPEKGFMKLYAWYEGQDSVFVDDLALETLQVRDD